MWVSHHSEFRRCIMCPCLCESYYLSAVEVDGVVVTDPTDGPALFSGWDELQKLLLLWQKSRAAGTIFTECTPCHASVTPAVCNLFALCSRRQGGVKFSCPTPLPGPIPQTTPNSPPFPLGLTLPLTLNQALLPCRAGVPDCCSSA